MGHEALQRWSDEVPEVDEGNPDCWVTFLKQHGPLMRRAAKGMLDIYDGNASKTARILGISAPTVAKFLQSPVMRFMLQERRPTLVPEFAVADREERAQFLTDIVRAGHVDVKDRLKALELLGKMNADYTDKVEVKGQISTLHELVRSLAEEPPPRVGVAVATVEPAPLAEPAPELEDLLS